MDNYSRISPSFHPVSSRDIYLLRKYSNKWLRKTFGSVSPTRAHIFYMWRLKAKVFYFWQENICHKIRWIMTVRADCNNKFRLLIKCMKAWKMFMGLIRIEQEQEYIADQLRYKFYAKEYFPAWKEFVLMRRFDKQQVNIANEFNVRKRIEQTFHIWLEEVSRKKVFNEMESRSLSLNSSVIKKRVWTVWLLRIQERNDRMQSILFANNYYNFKLIHMSFELLRDYTLHRRNTKLIYLNLKQDYQHRLMSHYLKRWRVRRLKEKNLRDKQKQIEELASRSKMRRLWLEWLYYTDFRRSELVRERAAKSFRIFTLKSHSWKCIVTAHRQKRVTEWKNQIALSLWVLWKYRHSWNEWEIKMDKRMELKQLAATKLARSHHARVILARSFKGFQSYWVARTAKKEKYKRIADYFERKLQSKCITSMKLYLRRQCIEREHSNLSTRFLREIFLNHYFYVWVDCLEQQRENNELLEKALDNHSCILLHSFFSLWREKYQLANNEKIRFLTADVNYRISLQKNVFIVWKHFVVICRERRDWKIFASNKYQTRITRICFYRMKQIFDRNQFIRRRCHELISLLDMTCVRKTFIAWKQYIVLVKEEQMVMLRAEEYCKIKVQLQALRVWRENIGIVKIQKTRDKLSEDFRNKHLIYDCFQIWKFTQIHVLERRFYEAERISKIRAKINNSCLARCFWGWLSQRDKTVIKRYNVMKADSHYSSCLSFRCVSQWKNAMVARKQFINMYQRACWFHLSSLLARTYTQWRLQLSLQRYYNHRHMLALWFWSRALERKVILALRGNARECRRKRGRYERAADEFKERVVKKGILQLIHAGNVMLTADETNLMRSIERNTKYSWGCALRCARIWRQKTISRKKNETFREVRRCALAVPSLTSHIPRQHSGVDRFWSEITDITVRGRALPAPRIPDFMKQTDNQIPSSSDRLESKSSSLCEVLTDAVPLITSHTDILASSKPDSKQREEMVNISNDDLKLLHATKQQLIQVYESKLLLKSVREKLAQSQSENQDSLDSEGVVEIGNRVRQITETIQILESSIKHNIDSFTQHFSVSANF